MLTETKYLQIIDKDTCNTYISAKVAGLTNSEPLVEPVCNGETVEGNTPELINFFINLGLATKEELIQNSIIEEKINKYCKPNFVSNGATYSCELCVVCGSG